MPARPTLLNDARPPKASGPRSSLIPCNGFDVHENSPPGLLVVKHGREITHEAVPAAEPAPGDTLHTELEVLSARERTDRRLPSFLRTVTEFLLLNQCREF